MHLQKLKEVWRGGKGSFHSNIDRLAGSSRRWTEDHGGQQRGSEAGRQPGEVYHGDGGSKTWRVCRRSFEPECTPKWSAVKGKGLRRTEFVAIEDAERIEGQISDFELNQEAPVKLRVEL